MKPLLTEREVAHQLSVSVETVRYWRKRGRGPRSLKLERTVRYRPEDLDAYLERAGESAAAS